MAVIDINRDSDVAIDHEWLDVDGDPIDLTGAMLSIVDNSLCPDLAIAIVTAVLGTFVVTQPYTSTRLMPHVAYYRVVVTLADGSTDSTPRIEINVS